MTTLPGKIVALHRALAEAELPHAFGGALALAWCTARPRGTVDIDLNVFVHTPATRNVLAALPDEIMWSESDCELIERDGQARLWWDSTPLDLFLNTTDFHDQVATRARWEPFNGVDLPFLSCTDLAVFKAFFNRTKDWADLEEMAEAGALDFDRTLGVLVRHLEPDDPRIHRLRDLGSSRRA